MNTLGEPISADEAFEYGLVNRVVEDHELFDAALAWARKLRRPGAAGGRADQARLARAATSTRAWRPSATRSCTRSRLRGRARGHRARSSRSARRSSRAVERAERLAELIRSAGPVVVLTGAGISVPSGIPDFRTPMTGLWANVDPMEVAHIAVWRRDPARFWAFYGQRFAILDGKEPNGAHRAIAELERRGLVSGVITQNIDGLHARPGTRPDRGPRLDPHRLVPGVRRVVLAGGDARGCADADGVPRCDCGAPLKPDVVLFGELLPERAMAAGHGAGRERGLMLAIGSSLEV